MREFLVEVGDLASKPGATKDIHVEAPIADLRGALAWLDDSDPVVADLVISSVSGGMVVEGDVSGHLHLSCSRCLVEYEDEFEQRVDESFYFERAEERGGYDIEANVIDLEPMLRDVIGLSLPIRPLHDEDCKGLCPECGADRNVEDCGHDMKPVDVRWAPLAGLFEAPGEKEEG